MVMAPGMFLDRVFVNHRGFEAGNGIWGIAPKQTVEFDKVRSVRITREETSGRYWRQIEVLYFDRKAGGAARFPLINDVNIEAAKEILAGAARNGIPLIRIRRRFVGKRVTGLQADGRRPNKGVLLSQCFRSQTHTWGLAL